MKSAFEEADLFGLLARTFIIITFSAIPILCAWFIVDWYYFPERGNLIITCLLMLLSAIFFIAAVRLCWVRIYSVPIKSGPQNKYL